MTTGFTGLPGIDDSRLQAPPAPRKTDDLGQEDFLTLMITQFQNQDPFEPMDNGQFLGQLAQFSTVSGIDSLNSGFDGLSGALRDEQALQAANLVGRTVVAETDTAFFDGSTTVEAAIDLPAAASGVQVDVIDATGQLVRRLELGQQPAGTLQFGWDGRDAGGDEMPPGQYTLSARVARGQDVESVSTLVEAEVESVTLGRGGGAMTLNLNGGGSLSLSQIYRIAQ